MAENTDAAPTPAPADDVVIPRKLRGWIALAVLIFCAAVIAVVMFVDPAVRSAGFSWAWGIFLMVLAGIGLAKPTETLLSKIKG
jgi:hypothetical protein